MAYVVNVGLLLMLLLTTNNQWPSNGCRLYQEDLMTVDWHMVVCDEVGTF
jgi:hypothetical protein